jgi:hypothetical protein
MSSFPKISQRRTLKALSCGLLSPFRMTVLGLSVERWSTMIEEQGPVPIPVDQGGVICYKQPSNHNDLERERTMTQREGIAVSRWRWRGEHLHW